MTQVSLNKYESVDAKTTLKMSVATDNKDILKQTKRDRDFFSIDEDCFKKIKIFDIKSNELDNNSLYDEDLIIEDLESQMIPMSSMKQQQLAHLIFEKVVRDTVGMPTAIAVGWTQESILESKLYKCFQTYLRDGTNPVQFVYRLYNHCCNMKGMPGLRTLCSFLEFIYSSCDIHNFSETFEKDFLNLVHDFTSYINSLKEDLKAEFRKGMLQAQLDAQKSRTATPEERAEILERLRKLREEEERRMQAGEESDDEDIIDSQAIFESTDSLNFMDFFTASLKSGTTLLDDASDKINDKIWTKLYDFVARVCMFFTRTLCRENISDMALPELVCFTKSVFAEGADILSTIFKGMVFLIERLPQFLRGEDTIFCGPDLSRELESRASTIKSLEQAFIGGDGLLLAKHGFTPASYDLELDAVLVDCNDALRTMKSAQKPYLSRLKFELLSIRNKIDKIHIQQVTRPEPFAIAMFGKSGVGKSTITPQLAKTMIIATGEEYSQSLVATGDINDKFDSVETSRHKCIIYDDVGNSSTKAPDFDKVLTMVNTQPRTFNKSEAHEKGKHFPSNTSGIITSNVIGLNAHVGSEEPASILRRFDYHIVVSIWDERVKAEGTERIDPILISKINQADRERIWTFDVYKFVTYDRNLTEEDMACEDKSDLVRLSENDFAWYRRVEHFDGSECDSLDNLKAFLGTECKLKYELGLHRVQLESNKEDDCHVCFHKRSACTCTAESQNTILDKAYGYLHNICDITDKAWVIVPYFNFIISTWMITPAYYYNIWSLFIISKCDDVDNYFDKKIDAARVAYWRFCFLHVVKAFITIYFENFIMYVMGVLTFFTGIGLFISWGYALLFVIIVAALTIRILYFMQCAKMQDLRFYRTALAPCEGELPKYQITRNIVKLISIVGACTMLYKLYKGTQPNLQSQKEEVAHSETEIRSFHKNVPRTEKSRCTSSNQFEQLMESNVAIISVKNSDGSTSLSNTVSLDSNLFLVVGHSIPTKGQFDIVINYTKEKSHLIAHEKLSEKDVYRIPDRDFCILHVPSSQPRKTLKHYLPYGNNLNEHKPCMGRNVKFVSATDSFGCQLTNDKPRSCKTTKAGHMIVETYHPQNFEPAQGDCGSAIISPVVSVIAGFHMGYLRNINQGAFQRIYRSDLENARKFFEEDNFVPHSTGELHKGNIELSLDCENATHLTSQIDPSVNLPLDKHNLCVYGANPLAKFSARNHYKDHPYKSSVEAVFGAEKYSPPFKINSSHHKRKALTKLASPNQDFVKQDVIYASDDYLKPIFDFIDNMTFDQKAKYGRVLSDQETLDGISGECLNGINNHTSVGFPYKGKKSKYLLMDEDDPNVPIMPRTLQPYNNTDMEVEVANLKSRYLNQESGGCVFKASMKTNELLPNHKIKGRVFMGCNFPFLLVVRQYLGGIIQLMGDNRFLFEMGKGIDMNGIDAHYLRQHLAEYSTDNVIALDYSAFDQTMSAQVSTQASHIIIKIMEKLGMDDNAITVAKGALTDMNYPNILFDGSIISLGNSNPSGQPLTTELNGIVNSLYLRILFFGLYPELKYKKNYKECIRTMTYGDDNISAVLPEYLKFNGETIVAAGKKVGLTITMADKDAKIVKFTKLDGESDFLKRTFRYCPILEKYRAPISIDSLKKRFYYMPLESPLTAHELFLENVDDAQRSASLYSREVFNEYQKELKQIADLEGIYAKCNWYSYDDLLKQAKINLEPKIISDDDMILESQSLVITKTSVSVFSLLFISYIFYLFIDLYAKTISKLEFMSDIFICRLSPNYYMLQVNAFLSKAVYITAGRSEEVKETTKSYINKLKYYKLIGYSRVLLSEIISYIFPYSSAVLHHNIAPFSRQLLRIDDTINNLTLTEERDVIRKQPLGLLLCGPPGCGKTFLTHALINALYSRKGGIKSSDVVTLNENDEFQSEYRSSHKVVIFDDIANSPPSGGSGYATGNNPFTKVIDFINNISKAALNPALESKGKILMKPDVVIATTNLIPSENISEKDPRDIRARFNKLSLGGLFDGSLEDAVQMGSVAPDSLLRRFYIISVKVNQDWVKTKDGFDSTRYKLFFRHNTHSNNDASVYYELSFDELLSKLYYIFEDHEYDQEQMVKSVNDMYSTSLEFELLPRHHKKVYFNVNQSSYTGIRTFIPQYKDDTIYELESQSKTVLVADCLYDGYSYVNYLKSLSIPDYRKILKYPGIPIPFDGEISQYNNWKADHKSRFMYVKFLGGPHYNNEGNLTNIHTEDTELDCNSMFPWTKHMTNQIGEQYFIIYKYAGQFSRIVSIWAYVKHFYIQMQFNRLDKYEYFQFSYIKELEEREILESQSDIMTMESSMKDMWKQFYLPQKLKKGTLNHELLWSVMNIPYSSVVLLPTMCGCFPSIAEEELNLKAQKHFRSLGWNIIAYECWLDKTSYDLLICKPGTDGGDPIIGVVECKSANPDKTFLQVISRMRALDLPSVVGYAYGLNRITFFGSISSRTNLNGVVTDTLLLDKCSNN